MSAQSEGFRQFHAGQGSSAPPDTFEVQAAEVLVWVCILVWVDVGGEKVNDVAVARRFFLVFVAGAVECVECHISSRALSVQGSTRPNCRQNKKTAVRDATRCRST